ncbi:MAG: SPOR domain-containing protein [Bdellovibrionales bacterium]|nr:SPOR domain-containing protein [Bdellovibrionales bacterium]
MQRSEKFFIFTWKELTVIGLLALISMGFFFTLGLHYGKKLPSIGLGEESHETAGKLEEGSEVIPPREALEQGAQHSGGATEESIKEATKEELKQTNVKLESPKQVDLPTDKKVEPKPETANPESAPVVAAAKKYAIQLGSYPSKKEAQLRIKALALRALHTEIRTAEVNGQTRYRVVIPGFTRKALADKTGKDLHAKHKIESFITIKD